MTLWYYPNANGCVWNLMSLVLPLWGRVVRRSAARRWYCNRGNHSSRCRPEC